ncbi:hypothetical protein ABZ341_33600 [Streptomyces sp. NPDC006173]|uniref:hypothetical protein n=1 Tax=Streptomyces sp. NPDC006173 TaxID=3155349 RepID=UPI0033EE76B5
MAKRIEHVPAGKFMTLDEIAGFAADAFGAGANGADTANARLSFSGRLQQLVAEVAVTE